MRALRAFAPLTALWLACCGSVAYGQQPPAASEQGVIGTPLMELPGELARIRYSSGSLQRAGQLQPAFELLTKEFARGSGRRQSLQVLLLNREEWEKAGLAMSYGLPARASGSALALAAWGDSGSVALWRRLLTHNLPTADDAPLRSTADEAASLVPNDLLGLFEGSRILMERAGFKGTERWITEVVAHTMAASVAAAVSGGSQVVSLYAHLGDRQGEPPLSLEGYRSGISIEEWLWYQAQFFNAAVLILEEERKGGRALLKQMAKNGGSLSRADLITRHSALNAWLVDSFAAGPTD